MLFSQASSSRPTRRPTGLSTHFHHWSRWPQAGVWKLRKVGTRSRCISCPFEDVATVKHVSVIKFQSAQVWGSFQATELLDEYARSRFICHRQVSSLLVLTSMQCEVVAISRTIESINSDQAKVNRNAAAIKNIGDGIKKMKKDSPPLK